MDIREPQSCITLFFASFQLINQAFSTLLVYILATCIGFGLVIALKFTPVPDFLIALLNSLYFVFVSVVFYKLLAARAEGENLSLPDAAASSLFPTLYMIVLYLLFGLAGIFLSLLGRGAGSLASRIGFFILMLSFFVAVFFAPLFVAVREQNPFAALANGVQLVKNHIFYVLTVMFLAYITPLLVASGMVYGFYRIIPLHFADSFNLAHLSASWIAVGIVCLLVLTFVQASMFAYKLLAFLNLDYQDNRLATPVLPQAQVTPESGAVLPPGAGPVAQPGQDDIQVTKSSVKTTAAEDLLGQHLDQVYQPQDNDVAKYAEEDRMPTVLFDDDLAQQIEQDRIKWEQEKSKSRMNKNSNGNENDSPIRMSK